MEFMSAACCVAGSVNFPFEELRGKLNEVKEIVAQGTDMQPLCVVCRRGNDSQVQHHRIFSQCSCARVFCCCELLRVLLAVGKNLDAATPRAAVEA